MIQGTSDLRVLQDPEKLREDSSVSTTPLYYYSDNTIHAVIDTLSTILASLMPTVSAFVLYFIRSPVVRLGGIVAFTFLFAVVLAVIARARRVECFAATTASVPFEPSQIYSWTLADRYPRLQVCSTVGSVRCQRRRFKHQQLVQHLPLYLEKDLTMRIYIFSFLSRLSQRRLPSHSFSIPYRLFLVGTRKKLFLVKFILLQLMSSRVHFERGCCSKWMPFSTSSP